MIADFHPRPVAPSQLEPLKRAIVLRRGPGKVVVRFDRRLAALFDRAVMARHDQGAGKGEIGAQGFNGERIQESGFDASVPSLGVDKKGASGSASRVWAIWNRWG